MKQKRGVFFSIDAAIAKTACKRIDLNVKNQSK
jgi:hypothetical protein